ncbi:CPBP family intramembrane glutamic endopeptidase [Chryseobacterium contaminans]|uniref:CPBP family intramembrane glutamic endopeptidase n=1 Tax=Chryseobacterium contaminans TaxID=1423959 RepID=UPI00301965E0
MIGIIVELFISWLLLHYIKKKNLSVLGFKPTRIKMGNLGIGFLLAALACILYQLMSTIFVSNSWILNKEITFYKIIISIWWVLKSVLFEELLFRGALLYILIEKWGSKRACLFSAICFGIYHWFSYGAFGNPVQMGIIFLMTGIFGFILAISFSKTQSLYLPIGLHLGWNLFNILVFSNGPLGKQILIKANENHLEGIPSLIVFLFQIFALPIFVYGYFTFYKPRQ